MSQLSLHVSCTAMPKSCNCLSEDFCFETPRSARKNPETVSGAGMLGHLGTAKTPAQHNGTVEQQKHIFANM